jgi:hypothetical protein
VDIVTHMGFIITIARIYDFLYSHVFDFIVDPERTSTECEEEREKQRERDLLRRLDIEDDPSGIVNPRGKQW